MGNVEPRLSGDSDRRAHKFTADVTERILSAVRAGNSVEVAAAYAGVHRDTLHRWVARAASPDATPELVRFREEYERARAEAEVRIVASVIRAAVGGAVTKRVTRQLRDGTVETEEVVTPPDGRVALEYLARAFPQRWARRQAIEVSGPEGGPMQLSVSPERLMALAERVHTALNASDVDVIDVLPSEDDPASLED